MLQQMWTGIGHGKAVKLG